MIGLQYGFKDKKAKSNPKAEGQTEQRQPSGESKAD
jgi:hypothetical protein